MKIFLAVVLCASLAHAAPADAPLAESGVVELKAGQPAPFDGTLVPDAERIVEGRKLKGTRAGLTQAKSEGTLVSTPMLVGAAIGVVVIILACVGGAYAKGRADAAPPRP